MSYQLIDPRKVPPEGFYYKQPVTGMEFRKASLEETVPAVKEHRIINHLERQSDEEVRADVEDQICKRVGYQWCRNMSAESWGFTLSWDAIKAGTKTLATEALHTLTGQDPWCSQAEAERRAEICSRCFANQRGGGCASCGFMDRVREVIAETCSEKETKVDDRLQSCLVCGCLLKCKVHYPSEVLNAGMSDKQRSAYADVPDCWMNTLD